ncbi:hypothetical protein K490DRAFT_35639 [Saccharata proteae CBS 121410]|uniref:NADH dehydrogenase [ubiquinone] 1 alpha subcomplex assembly factor 3 n=1 Tax=Saccharata proteae CBS 121410 TaxID=1314787 RepID=A0A9P4HVU9_9PEZI|nr:hypothetical protein K490DRAFT_35639 [Saccharata proteae CBS 121410]
MQARYQSQSQYRSHCSPSRLFHTSVPSCASRPPKSRDRGPTSSETTQTDFGSMDVLGSLPAPTTGIDATTSDGFSLNSGTRVSGSGVLLLGGEAFRWRPWIREGRKEGTIVGRLRNEKGMWECDTGAWGVLDLVWPKPDLLILGTGPQVVPVSPATRKRINDLGIRLEISDTRNAAAQFNLLATERGVQQVAAALIPLGWKEGK